MNNNKTTTDGQLELKILGNLDKLDAYISRLANDFNEIEQKQNKISEQMDKVLEAMTKK